MSMVSAAFITGDYALNMPKPEPNGCAYYRMALPSRQLQSMGWDTAMGLPRVHPERGIGVAHDDGAFFGFNVSVFKLLMHESVPSLMNMMQSRGEKIVVDVDDFHFGIDPDNIAARKTDPNKNAESNRMFYEMGIRQADVVTVSTEFLANFYEARCRRVRLVRNALDVERYDMVEQIERPVFGWVGGTLWRSRDIEMLRDWLPAFVDDHKVGVHHSGPLAAATFPYWSRSAALERFQSVQVLSEGLGVRGCGYPVHRYSERGVQDPVRPGRWTFSVDSG
jgi:hypothetical protein